MEARITVGKSNDRVADQSLVDGLRRTTETLSDTDSEQLVGDTVKHFVYETYALRFTIRERKKRMSICPSTPRFSSPSPCTRVFTMRLKSGLRKRCLTRGASASREMTSEVPIEPVGLPKGCGLDIPKADG